MATDPLVARLRELASKAYNTLHHPAIGQAADEIERLHAALDEAHDLLEEAIKIAYTPRSVGDLTRPWLERTSKHFARQVSAALK